MAKKIAGYTITMFHGVAGATAATQILRGRDMSLDASVEYADTTDRGDGSSIPKEDNEPVKIGVKITWSMTVKEGDTVLTTLLACATHKLPASRLRAIKYVNPVTGTLFDGDCYLKATDGAPLGGAATYDFEAVPTTAGGRDWLLLGV